MDIKIVALREFLIQKIMECDREQENLADIRGYIPDSQKAREVEIRIDVFEMILDHPLLQPEKN